MLIANEKFLWKLINESITFWKSLLSPLTPVCWDLLPLTTHLHCSLVLKKKAICSSFVVFPLLTPQTYRFSVSLKSISFVGPWTGKWDMRKEAGILGFGLKGQRGGFRKLNKGGTFKKRIVCVFGGKFFINYFIYHL